MIGGTTSGCGTCPKSGGLPGFARTDRAAVTHPVPTELGQMSFLRSSITPSLRASLRTASIQRVAMRSIATTPLRFSEHHAPIIQGEGTKPGTMGTDESQSTGLERFELMGRLQGVDVFDMSPLDASRPGTMKNPIKVQSMVR